MCDLAAAIATITESRRTHVGWRDFLLSGETYEPDPGDVGDEAHHEGCIREYDNVLDCLSRAGGDG